MPAAELPPVPAWLGPVTYILLAASAIAVAHGVRQMIAAARRRIHRQRELRREIHNHIRSQEGGNRHVHSH